MTKPLLALAPMAGVTDAPFRLLCARQGADITYTEMISAQGMLQAPPNLNAYRFLTQVWPGEGKVVAQVFGTVPTLNKASSSSFSPKQPSGLRTWGVSPASTSIWAALPTR